ncbi:TRAPP trafficking subunit Trs65-domain-containing protein [Poronia punctata]|nr:TRAPP trafficking subunit Trs65-domain-containing protein [Poronia punctata]
MGDSSSSHTYPELQPDLDLAEQSRLVYLVPRATDFAPDEIFKNDEGISFEELLDSIEQRDSLFFDESVHVILVLKIPYIEDDAVQAAFLKSLVITLDAQIVNGSTPDRDSSPASEVIYSDTLDGSQDPIVVIRRSPGQDEADGSESGGGIAVWRTSVFLNRPRMRLQTPSVVFVATAGSRSTSGQLSGGLRTGYMQSGVPSSLNLLEAFASDPALNGIQPRLSALRVSRVAPNTQQVKQFIRPIDSLSRLSLRIYPVAHSRIRFTHPNTVLPSAARIAMLEIDFTPFFECEIILDEISLAMDGATVEDLTKYAGVSPPLSCVAHDHVTFLYRIAPIDDADAGSQSSVRDLDIAILARALVDSHTTPLLKMAWTAAVDFTVPVNPGYGSTTQPIQRAHRPSQLSIGGESAISLIAPSVARPDALPSLEASTTQTETPVQSLGITVTFTAPPPRHQILVGDTFSWDVLVANQSQKQSATPRKLAMVVIPKRRRNESRVTRPPSTSPLPDQSTPATTPKGIDVAEATLDDNVVYAMQSSSIVDDAELMCLSADVRIGPLAPGTCHATELKFLALKEGIVSIDAVRIIDLASNEHVDMKYLPTMAVESKRETSS